ncbi:MAG: hypothetical protein NTW38_01835 [Candidatus Aminicenantes bacterium]|nr:hypothetical protein [Candidatus Aminicenantes bacterium]
MKRKKPVKIDNFYPLVAYIKDYLRKEKPGRDATRIQKDRYAQALKCIIKLDGLFKDKNVLTGTYMLHHGCGVQYPIVPPIVVTLFKK